MLLGAWLWMRAGAMRSRMGISLRLFRFSWIMVRFAAALIVFLEHAKPGGQFVGSARTPFDNLSGEAVITFFVLSGFVIAATTDPGRGWRDSPPSRAPHASIR